MFLRLLDGNLVLNGRFSLDYNFIKIPIARWRNLLAMNSTRIPSNESQFKLKKEIRPSPPISATHYKPNTIKLGSNKKFWIVKNNKWNEIKSPTIIKKYTFKSDKNIYKILDIPQIGEYNNIPLFIYNINDKRKTYIITIIGIEESLNNFEKKYIK